MPARLAALVLMFALGAAGAAFAQGTIAVGDLPPGESVQILFDAVIDNAGLPFPLPPGTTFVVNQGTVNGTNFTSLLTDDPDDVTSDMDPTVTPIDLLDLGNVVWQDDGDGVFDGGILDTPVGGVLVNLFTDDGGTPGVLDATDTLRASTPTVAGVYTFSGITPGEYIVQIDASNFAAGMPLENFFSVVGSTDPDNDVDNDDNGVDAFDFTGGISSMAITLVTDTEPDTPADGDDVDGNLTLDFGFGQVADIAVTKSVDNATIIAGDAVNGVATYTLTVTNDGPADATNVVVQDDLTLPANVTLTNSTASQGTFTSGTGEWLVGSLSSGSSATLDLEITAAANAIDGAQSTNQGSLTSLDQDDDNATNDTSATITVTVEREVDIRVEKDGSPDPTVIAGSGGATNLTYFVRAFNDGPSDATNIVVQDDLTLPANVNLISTSVSQGSFDSGTGVWTVGDIATGGFAQLTIDLKAESSAADGAVITNTGTLTSVDETETAPGNNSQTVNTTVAREVDIRVEKVGAPDPEVVAGAGGGVGNLVHTVTVTNDGPSDATAIVIDDAITVPAGVTFDPPVASQGSFAGSTWTLGDLVSGASATLTVTYNVSSAAADGDSVGNIASLDSVAETELNPGNNGQAVVTDIVREVDVRVEKVGLPDPDVVAGAGGGVGNLVHTVTVTNDGPSDSTAIVIEDLIAIPAGVTVDPPVASQGSFAGTTWTLGDLVNGASATLTITYNVSSAALAGSSVVNTATLDSVTETETGGGANAAAVTTTIIRVADLTLTKTESVDPVLAGTGAGNLVYVVTVLNNGPSDITSLTLDEVVVFPAGVTLDSVVVSSGAYAPPDDPNGTWTLDLATGASETLTATLTVDETAVTGTDVISDTATVTGSGGGETLGGDSSVTESTSIFSDKDYGDAPDPVEITAGEYPTLLANDGARHLLVPGDVFLGASVDSEADGQPTVGADGDDLAGSDDEDGVTFAGGVLAGATTEFDVVASAAGLLSVWVDFEVDGDWTGTGEQVFADEPLVAGVNTLSFVSPVTAFDSDLATLLGGTFVRFRFSSGGGLLPTGFAIGGEVEDYFVEISTDADLEVSMSQLANPLVAGDVQIYDLTVTNNGPAQATDVTLQLELPKGGIFLGAEPDSLECALLSGVLVDCDLGVLAVSDSVVVAIGVLMDHHIDGPVTSEAVVDANEPDPDSSNDQADVDTDVAIAREALATNRGADDALAIIAKEGDNSVGIVFVDPDGGGDREYSVEGLDFRATSMTRVSTFGGTGSPEVAVLAAGFGGGTKVVVVDADDQTLLGDYDIAGDWHAMDIVSVADFDDSTAPEVAVLLRDLVADEVRVQVLDASTGTVIRDHTVATSTPNPPFEDIAAPFPIGMVAIDSFGGTPRAELAILMKNPDTREVRVLVVDADSGATLGDHSQGTDLFPLGIVDVGDLGLGGGTTAADVAILVRRASDGDLFATVLDASNGSPFGPIDFDDTLVPGPFDAISDFGGSTAPELAVTGREDPDGLTVSIKDAATGAVVNTIAISSPPLVPVPLDLEHHPSFAAGPAPELAVVFEYFDEPAQVQVFNGVGAVPLFTFFLP